MIGPSSLGGIQCIIALDALVAARHRIQKTFAPGKPAVAVTIIMKSRTGYMPSSLGAVSSRLDL